MSAAEQEYRPLGFQVQMPGGGTKEFWMIEGRLLPRRDNIGLDTSEATREMKDIEARLRHMDVLDVNVQVLYPTVFLRPLTARREADVAICRSYNRWLAEIWSVAKDRLPWAAVLPTLDIQASLQELRWCRDHGAVAVFIRGLEAERRLSDPYFFPLYQLASDLEMPIGIHSATGSFVQHDFFGNQEPGFNKFKLAVVGSFHSLVYHEIPPKFPKLRWGWIEVSAQWVPYVLHDLAIRFRRRGKELPANLLQEWNLYVACQTDDDLDYVLKYSGPDRLIIGSDYGHADTSSELEALRTLKGEGKVEPVSIDRILWDNPKRFYGL
jgi:predicted TIM-barrel fold metal-dependent hydrolase